MRVTLFALLLALSAPAFADTAKNEGARCSSYEATYKPNPSLSTESKYQYRMQVEKIDGAHAGEPFARFLLDTLNAKGDLLSRLKLTFGCDGSGAATCRAWYTREYHYDDKPTRLEPKTFDVVALNRDFTTHPQPVADSGSFDAPYALVFPGLPQALSYTRNWERMQQDVEYFTPEKIPPSEVTQVWLLEKCGAPTE